MEFKSKPMRTIEIRTTHNDGYIVNVGCTNFAYGDEEKMIADLGDYIRDPQGVEEQYNKHFKAYDECAPTGPTRGGEGLGSSVEGDRREIESAFEEVPDKQDRESQPEVVDPAEDIPSSGY
jgi:hypothetical protein